MTIAELFTEFERRFQEDEDAAYTWLESHSFSLSIVAIEEAGGGTFMVNLDNENILVRLHGKTPVDGPAE